MLLQYLKQPKKVRGGKGGGGSEKVYTLVGWSLQTKVMYKYEAGRHEKK
jgi:hypothetical protein